MMESLSMREHMFINNTQYYHKCLDGAKEKDNNARESIPLNFDLDNECM